MKAAILRGKRDIRCETVPDPKIEAGGIIVKVKACGICGSDLAIISVPQRHPADPNTVLGHEYFGHVVDIGDRVTHVQPGDRVAIIPNLECGVCAYCRLAMGNHCLNWAALGVHINGGFAEYNLAPARAVIPISPELPLEEAAFL